MGITHEEAEYLLNNPEATKDVMKEIEANVIDVKRGGKKQDNDDLRKAYYEIKEVLKYYVDMKEEYYSLIAIWIIGTYFHKNLNSYPYLFLNAMKGSAKSRTLRLAISLSKDGNVMTSPTEAVLFRTDGTLGIDEFENLGNKEKGTIRELLNACYKKGVKVFRMKRKKTIEGDVQVVEEFEPYRPIVMANISGIEEVLGDRCIQLILEKSSCPVRTKLIEIYEVDENIKNIKKIMEKCIVCSVELFRKLGKMWNGYIIDKSNSTLSTFNTDITHTTRTTLQNIKIDQLFNKIDESNIYGRELELFLPLFFIAYALDETIFEELVKIAKDIIKEKETTEGTESRDIMLLDFISRQEEGMYFNSVKELTNNFKQDIEYEPIKDDDWLNTQWFGKALKRLSLIIDKRRMGRGIEVMLNVPKAQEKYKMFKR